MRGSLDGSSTATIVPPSLVQNRSAPEYSAWQTLHHRRALIEGITAVHRGYTRRPRSGGSGPRARHHPRYHRRVWREVIVVLVFAGCGRIAFDPLTPPDAPPDAATDATRTACDGVAPAGCIVADCPAVPSCVLYCSYAQATWNGARVECQARGGDLASVSTQAALACIVATRGASPGA